MTTASQIAYTLVMLLLAAGTHYLVYRWAISAVPRIARHRKKIAAAVGVWLLMAPLARFIAVRTQSTVAASLNVAIITEVMVVFVASLPLFVLRVGSWLAGRGWKKKPAPAAVSEAPLTRRQVIEGIGGVAILGGTGTALGWGAVRGRHAFEVEEVVVRIAGLPRALDGYTIAQISDIHVGLFVGDRELGEGLARVTAMRPDLIVATGDLVDFDHSYAPQLARALADLKSRDGVFCIPGNHDYYAGVENVLTAMRAGGVRPLVNDGVLLRAGDGGGFALLGVDDLWAAGRGGAGPVLSRAMARVPDDRPRILLSHQPASVDRWAGKVALQLSGHTHGGQINPGFRPADALMRYVAGRYEVRGTTLWVNRGFGTSGPPSRLGAPPEVTKIVLVSA